jgi:hypothetical protein
LQTGIGAGFSKRRSNRTTWTDEGLYITAIILNWLLTFEISETVFFYKCLNSVGTDFAMMTRFFPHRTRHQIKLKFKLEEKRNPVLVDKALGTNATYDVVELENEYSKIPLN